MISRLLVAIVLSMAAAAEQLNRFCEVRDEIDERIGHWLKHTIGLGADYAYDASRK
jgi:hypothetical protein